MIDAIKNLTQKLNQYCDAYYNGQELISDTEYDLLYQELLRLEDETGFFLSSSPTRNVGYKVHDELPKFKHDIPMLSLDKITTTKEIIDFIDSRDAIMSVKEDGLSIRAIYGVNGKLKTLATRGTGEEGSNITENLCAFTNIPVHIETNGKEFIIDGEAICTFENLERLNKNLENPYKHPRALASGSVSLLDQNEAKNRQLQFIAWKFVQGSSSNSYGERLEELDKLGFDVVPWCRSDIKYIDNCLNMLKSSAQKLSHPYDGIVISLDDIAYGESLGSTSKFPHHSKAYKFEQDAEETTIRRFEFSLGKTGQLTPVACFDVCLLDGTDVSRASCHNISYCKNLKLGAGAKVKVIKSMQIIPQIIECVEEGSPFVWPNSCPVCGGLTEIQKDNDSEVLICTNPDCSGKLLGKLKHFVSKKAANVMGLSEATLELFLEQELINSFVDIYRLKNHKDKLLTLPGFGAKSVEKLLQSIEKSREIKLESFITALGINGIGLSASKTIAQHFNGNIYAVLDAYDQGFDWTQLNDFGAVMAESINTFLKDNVANVYTLAAEMKFIVPEKKQAIDNPFTGKTLVVTGKLNHFTRDSINEKIASLGAKTAGSVSKKTDYLITNEASGSSKYKKAVDLGVPVITEDEFLRMINE